MNQDKELMYVVLLTTEQKERMRTLLKDQEGFKDIFTEIDLSQEMDDFLNGA